MFRLLGCICIFREHSGLINHIYDHQQTVNARFIMTEGLSLRTFWSKYNV